MNKTKIVFNELEELFKMKDFSTKNIRTNNELNERQNATEIAKYKKAIYMSYLGTFLLKKICNEEEKTIEEIEVGELLEKCQELRGSKTTEFNIIDLFLNIDKYTRFYMLDRLQPTEKKILLDYILDKYIINPDGSLKEPDIEYEDILNGEHNVVDYFMQNFGLTKTPIYIMNHKGKLYYRIYETSQVIKPRSAPIQTTALKYFDALTKKRVSITIERELEKAFKITHHHVGIIDYKYCNHFGMVNSILEEEEKVDIEKDGKKDKVAPIKEYLGQSHIAKFALNVADMNNTKVHMKSIKERRSGINIITATSAFYKEGKIGSYNALYYTIIDMYQHLFNLPQVEGRVGGGAMNNHPYKNYIKIIKQKKNPEASIILENAPEPIVIKFAQQQIGKGKKYRGSSAQKPELIMKYELISRFIRDIVTMYFEMGDKRMPAFWFINTDEVNARFLPQFSDIYHNKIWVREWDYVHKMCNQMEKMIELDSKKQLKCEICGKNKKDGTQLYFNENSIVCEAHRSGGGVGRPKENLQLIGDVEILQLEDPPEDSYHPVPKDLDPSILSKVFNFINSNYNSCIYSSKFK